VALTCSLVVEPIPKIWYFAGSGFSGERSSPGYLRCAPTPARMSLAARMRGNRNYCIRSPPARGKGVVQQMADNRVVVYKGPGEVAVEDIEYPKLEVPEEVAGAMGMTVEAPHAVILRIVATNI
jgi:hypothetical protein